MLDSISYIRCLYKYISNVNLKNNIYKSNKRPCWTASLMSRTPGRQPRTLRIDAGQHLLCIRNACTAMFPALPHKEIWLLNSNIMSRKGRQNQYPQNFRPLLFLYLKTICIETSEQ